MPSMFEIYQKHAAEYDELVDAEDFQGNLSRYLLKIVDWKGQEVIEGGVGTGRVTAIYVDRVRSVLCIDRSPHMMEAAARRLRKFSAKVSFQEADNLSLPTVEPKRSVFIEGWSWGHSIVSEPAEVETVAEF